MIATICRLWRRIKAIRHVELEGDHSIFIFHKDVEISAESKSQIIVKNSIVRIGYPLPGVSPFSSYPQSKIYLGRNSKIIFDGPVVIAPGLTIRVKENATLIFGGRNYIAHNFLVLCSKQVTVGADAAISWNVTLIDDDGHFFRSSKGRLIKGIYRPLIIGKNVGIQMNCLIPRGINVGDNSVISCGTVVRKDIPPECLAYQNTELRLRVGISAPLG